MEDPNFPDFIRNSARWHLSLFSNDGNFDLRPMVGGANNRVYHLIHSSGEFCLKHYREDPNSVLNRMDRDFLFSQFAFSHGIHSVAEPLSKDPSNRTVLFRYLSGEKLVADRLTQNHIEQATRFLVDLNFHREDALLETFPNSTESCFALADHLALIEGRVGKLLAINGTSSVDERAKHLVEKEVLPLWESRKLTFYQKALEYGLDLARPLAQNERILSPSDFGFHNAIVDQRGSLSFFDFEYGGWDDPAKTLSDFFYQPQLRVGRQYVEQFLDSITRLIQHPAEFHKRFKLLFPIYHVKWCCIILNLFTYDLPTLPAKDLVFRKELQLQRLLTHLGDK